MDFLRECHRSLGMTVLLVTHERALAERYSSRVLTLADGKLVDDVLVSATAAAEDGR
jgi:ABC-type sulfate/molybdate transport systems ATPase subunit